MWWKLSVLLVSTAVLIFSVVPVRTHSSSANPAGSLQQPTFWTIVSNMYLTSGTVLLISAIVAVAAAIGFWIVRSA